MAKTKYPTTDLIDGELRINIYPRQWDSWSGTAAQLVDAGLIPDEFKWPVGTAWTKFHHLGVECGIQRRKRPGMGRNDPWVNIDHWDLTRYCEGRGNGGADIHEKQEALRHALWWHSPAGKQMSDRYWVAHEDEIFQRVKLLMLNPRISDRRAAA